MMEVDARGHALTFDESAVRNQLNKYSRWTHGGKYIQAPTRKIYIARVSMKSLYIPALWTR